MITFADLMKGGVKIMLIIPIKDGENIDRALKRYKRKFDKTGTVRQLRARTAFIKPSVKNRIKVQKAAYIQNMRDNLDN
ncbi:MAG: small subunit ribosomal protein S21 [Flavobacterium sp.]